MNGKRLTFQQMIGALWNRLHFKIAVGTTVFTSVILFLTFTYFLYSTRSERMNEFVERAKSKTKIIYLSLETAMSFKTPETAHAVADQLVQHLYSSKEFSYLAILDKNGDVWLSSNNPNPPSQITSYENTCYPCHRNNESKTMENSWIFSLNDGQEYYRIASIFRNASNCMQCHDSGSAINGLLIADFPMRRLKTTHVREFRLMSLVLAVSLGTMLFSLRFLLKHLVVNRINHLSERTRLVGRGELKPQDTVHGNDELARIERDFNAMCLGLIEQKKRNEELHKELIDQEKMAVVGQLVAGIAHDFNTPLGIVLSRLECLKLERDDAPLRDDVQNDLEVIERQVLRLSRTVQGLLSFSKQAPVPYERINAKHVVDEAMETCRPSFERRSVQLECHYPLSPIYLYGNSVQLEQMLINLLNNSLDAVHANGMVRINIQTDPQDSNGTVILTIEDNGPGFFEDHFKRAFVPFVTSKESGKGTGLGLAIVAQIVSQHGGSITLGKSDLGGASIKIMFPVNETKVP